MIDDLLIQQFLELSKKEFEDKTWGSTEQYTEVLEVLTEGDFPLIKRIEQLKDGTYAVYYAIKGEQFYYTHYFEATPQVKLRGDGVSPATAVYLRVHSDRIPLNELLSITTLNTTRKWQKGELKNQNPTFPFFYNRKGIPTTFTDSGFFYEPDTNKAGNFENKIATILTDLENYKHELSILSNAGCYMYIATYWHSYYGNTDLGNIHLNKQIIKQLSDLDLEINFDIYTGGEPFN